MFHGNKNLANFVFSIIAVKGKNDRSERKKERKKESPWNNLANRTFCAVNYGGWDGGIHYLIMLLH